jgi:hypothetical protein
MEAISLNKTMYVLYLQESDGALYQLWSIKHM